MCSAIKEFGFRIPVVARSDSTVVDGDLRLKAARQLGLSTVPVVLADELTDAQVKAFRLLANEAYCVVPGSSIFGTWEMVAA
jgi:ParB-like chromosome segregation protein Spo0J